MTAGEHVRVVLVECRRRGWGFDESWLAAIRSLPRPQNHEAAAARREWLEALAWSRPFFLAAYVERPFAGTPPLEPISAAGHGTLAA